MNSLFILLIRFYKYAISPFLGLNCRFDPSCSQYADACLKKFSLVIALWYSFRRICKCHPFHPGGHDPVP